MSHAVDPGTTEAHVLEAAQRGEIGAFNRLVQQHQTAVYNVALRTLGSPEDAADIAQESFVSAFRAIKEFRGGSFKAWLLRITVNACYDLLRRRQRRPARSLEEIIDDGGEVASPEREPGPEGAALSAETARAVQDGLATLPEDQRVLVILCDVQGLSYEEAAEACGVALGTVKSRLSRARSRLREFLTERGELPSDFRRPTT